MKSQAIKKVEKVIKDKSFPLSPILLNSQGYRLLPDRPTHDMLMLGSSLIGEHEYCGHFKFCRTSSTHAALICGNCHYHLPVPLTVQTLDDIGEYCQEEMDRQRTIANSGFENRLIN
jgi:hypothetical protein